MDPLLTLATVFAIFIPALLLPGPDFIAVVRSALTRGLWGGLGTALGVSLGLAFYATLSLLGLSALLVEYQWLTWVVRVLGGGYLIYLGIRLILTRPETIDVETLAPAPTGQTVLFGFAVTLTNPKAVVLFASVFATAVTEQTPSWLLMAMIALVFASGLIWYAIVTAFMASPPVMRQVMAARHTVERVAGACFIAIGGKIIADARGPAP